MFGVQSASIIIACGKDSLDLGDCLGIENGFFHSTLCAKHHRPCGVRLLAMPGGIGFRLWSMGSSPTAPPETAPSIPRFATVVPLLETSTVAFRNLRTPRASEPLFIQLAASPEVCIMVHPIPTAPMAPPWRVALRMSTVMQYLDTPVLRRTTMVLWVPVLPSALVVWLLVQQD